MQPVASTIRYSEIARQLGVSRQRVWSWFGAGRRIPAEWVLKLEAASGIARHQLRPDLYPPAPSRKRRVAA